MRVRILTLSNTKLGHEARLATPCIAKSDFPAACLVPSSEYKLHYLLTIFGNKLFQLIRTH